MWVHQREVQCTLPGKNNWASYLLNLKFGKQIGKMASAIARPLFSTLSRTVCSARTVTSAARMHSVRAVQVPSTRLGSSQSASKISTCFSPWLSKQGVQKEASWITKNSLLDKVMTQCTGVNSIACRGLATEATPKGIQTSVSSLQAKKRSARKRITKPGLEPAVPSLSNAGILFNQDVSTVIAYATAEEYNLEALSAALQKQGLYQPASMPEDVNDVLHVSAKYQVGREPRQVYFFREGSVVFWNVPDLERDNVLKLLITFEDNSYSENLIHDENEVIDYTYTDNKTRLVNGRIWLNSEGSTDLEKYTFSNAMALSVKLALWEASLDKYVDSIEFVTEDMKVGKKITMSRQQVLQKMGELYSLRHLINLSSDLLDTPDFYWDRETLEALYHKTCNHLNIAKRTRVMNEKLNHCNELIQLLSDHLNDRHHVRLEWMIIVLIMVEVLFEMLHMVEKRVTTKDATPKRALVV